jgi:5-methyltetrahydropteroyltriglutamate--homocysteine methyltransferase
VKRSTERILTTHIGSLPREERLGQLLNAKQRGEPTPNLDEELKAAVQATVAKQLEVGLDVINDGEMAKPTWSGYVRARLKGFSSGPVTTQKGREQAEFPEYWSGRGGAFFSGGTSNMMVCTSPIEYVGQAEAARDVANLKAAVAGKDVVEVFMAAVGPDNIGYHQGQNQYYPSDDEYLRANAAAMREEYKAITDAGFILQIDTPVMKFNALNLSVPDFRQRFEKLVGVYHEMLSGIPREQVRMHICFGGGRGPHTGDIMLRDFIDLVLQMPVTGISFDQNVRHEHEWKIFREVKVPPDKVLIPGVVAHTTDTVEHPELVADRLVRLAQLVGRENVIAGTDCGLGGRLPQEIVWAKFRTMVEGARLATKVLWG